MKIPRRLPVLLSALALLTLVGGCAFAHLGGAMAQNFEYQKEIEVLAKYTELENQRIAVIVDADLSVIYDYPKLIEQITTGVTLRLGRDVPGASVIHPSQIIAWQWQTPQWNALPYGEIAETLDVDRVVFIDIYEFRLNPPGNRWLWEGVCGASVSVIERDGFDPDTFAESFNVTSNFPGVKGVDRSSATADRIETGVLAKFIKKTAWLFHTHIEPKYPDKYQGGDPA